MSVNIQGLFLKEAGEVFCNYNAKKERLCNETKGDVIFIFGKKNQGMFDTKYYVEKHSSYLFRFEDNIIN